MSQMPNSAALPEARSRRNEGARTADPVDLRGRLRLRRKLLGMSQKRLAGQLGITLQQVQKYENGANRIAAGSLLDIARVLDVPVLFFYEGAPPSTHPHAEQITQPKSTIDEFLRSHEGFELNKALVRVSDAKARLAILAFVRHLSNHGGG